MDANSIRYEFLKRVVKNKIRTFPYQILNEEEQKLRGEIEDLEIIKTFKEKDIKFPVEVSILPKDQKGMKILRENKKNKKIADNEKSKKKNKN